MSSRGHGQKRQGEILVVTPAFAAPSGSAYNAVGDLLAAISTRAPFRFTWAARASETLPEIPGQTLLPMRGWNVAENVPGFRWPYWDRASLVTLRHAIAGADCVWLHDTLYPGARAAFRMARAFEKPVLVTQHDNPVFAAGYGGNLQRTWTTLKDRYVTARLLRRAQQVTFTSDNAARFYHRSVPFQAPIKIIPLGVDQRVFCPPSTEEYKELRAKFSLRDDQPVMLFAGRFEAASGLPVIQQLAKILPKWRFWLAGEGSIKPESWYLPNVQVFRGRNSASTAELYRASDLLLLPGYDTESPRVLQEAVACDLSVMCSPAVVAGGPGTPKCLVVKVDPDSPDRTARHWLQKLKAGHSAWPETSEKTPFDNCWDWLQIADSYSDILSKMCRVAAW